MVRSRRQTLQSLAGLAGGLALAGCTEQSTRNPGNDDSDDPTSSEPDPTPTQTATTDAQDSTGSRPDFGGYLDDATNYDGTVVDETGQQEVTVRVGAGDTGLAFGPAAVHVDNGATVEWEWTGEGGAHNVVAEDDSFDSGSPVAEAGVHFEHTFETDGIYRYYCNPHKATRMVGAVVVGSDYPSVAPGSEPPEATTTAAETTSEPYLQDVDNYDGTVTDRTEQRVVTVEVGTEGNAGNFAFEPPALRITTGTPVKFEWTGKGGAHNIVAEDESFDSGDPVAEGGVQFEHTFEQPGRYEYYCAPHKALGMKGVVEVVE